MKSLIILLLVICLAPCCLKAQDATLGKTKEEIRALIKPNSGITISTGDDCDTLSMQGGLRIYMFYKNNICISSKSIMPLQYMSMVTDKMTNDSYKKISENEWLNPSGTVKVNITILKVSNQFSVETSHVSNPGN